MPANVRISTNLSRNRIKQANGIEISGSVLQGQAAGEIRPTLHGNHKRVMKPLDDSNFVFKFTPAKIVEYKVTAHFKSNESNLGNKSATRTLSVR